MTKITAPLDLDEITSVLQSTPILLEQQAKVLPDRVAVWHPSGGKWCVKEIVGHLIEEDKRDFVGRIRLMLDQDEPRLAVNDQDEVARARNDCAKSLGTLLDEFCTVRSNGASFVGRLKGEELNRRGVHPKIGAISVGNLLNEWIYHDLNHLRQIEANVQRFLWDHLGNMQQFYKS
jgi:hypothetical protein